MVKSDIIKELAMIGYYDKNGQKLKHNQVKTIVDDLFGLMAKSLSNGKRIEIRGFGCFSLKHRAAGLVRNPRHGVAVESPARNVVYFRPGQLLARRVNDKNIIRNELFPNLNERKFFE